MAFRRIKQPSLPLFRQRWHALLLESNGFRLFFSFDTGEQTLIFERGRAPYIGQSWLSKPRFPYVLLMFHYKISTDDSYLLPEYCRRDIGALAFNV
jgi:hypothetical protein